MMLPVVTFADVVEIDGIYYNLIKKAKTAEVTSNPNKYSGCVVIPDKVNYEDTEYSVTSIGQYAFQACSGLTSVTIPNSVTSIGESAFSGCNHLTSVHISDLEAWCNISFYDYSSNPLWDAHHLFLNGEEIKDLVIPNSVTSIGQYAFQACSDLNSITIPNSVTSIGNSAFLYCSSLTSVTIPNSVTSIGNSAFCGCSSMTSITIPNSVTSIGESTFSRCSSMTSITIPNSVTAIGWYAFQACSDLNSITIPNSVTTIGGYAFRGCSSMTSIIIGNGIKTIYTMAFANCADLTDVYCLAENVPIMLNGNDLTCTDAFDGSYIEYATLHAPAASVNAYKATAPWSNFKTITGIDGTVLETPKCATPTISYQNGKLLFSSDTEGVDFVSEITDTDIKKNYGSEVQLSATYTITVCATKSGYDDSDVATATLCWIDQQPKTEGITDGVVNVTAKAVLIKNNGGLLTVEGVDDGETIDVYTIDGARKGSSICQNGVARIDTNIQSGNFAIVKIGQKSIKVLIK